MENKPFIGIIGCGRTGSILINRLIESWHLLLIDKNETIVKKLKNQFDSEQASCFSGDSTSYSFLRETNIKRAYQVLICIEDDEISNEIIHLLKERMNIRNIICQIMDITLAENLRKQGIVVVYPPDTVANFMINRMPLGQNIATHVGKGEGEIMQIQITKSSPLVGMPLSSLPPRKWIVGAIYRPKKTSNSTAASQITYIGRLQISKSDRLIIPQGSTKPQVGDKLLLIGDSHVLKATSQYLKAGSPVFPKRHGEVVVSLFLQREKDISAHKEYQWLLRNMEPSDMYYFYNAKAGNELVQKLRFPKNWSKAGKDQKKSHHIGLARITRLISNIAEKNRIGLVIYKQPVSIFFRLLHRWFFLPFLIKKVRTYDTPLWIIKKHERIKAISLFVYTDDGTLRAAELAVDAALKLRLDLKAIQINPPAVIAGKMQLEKSKEIMQSIREICALYGVNIQEVIREGNPVAETIQQVRNDELLVLSLPKESQERFLIPNSSRLLYKKFSGSVLILAT